MSPEKQKEIQTIVEKIGVFLNELAQEYVDFDIRLVKFDIESHSEDEVDEKETLLQVTINDCATIAKEEAEEDRQEEEYREKVKKELEEEQIQEQESEEKQKQNDQDEITESQKDNDNNETSKSDTQKGPEEPNQDSYSKINTTSVINQENLNTVAGDEEQTSESKIIDSQDEEKLSDQESIKHEHIPKSKPTVMYLNLSENGQEIMKILEKKRGKRPILVLIEQVNDQRRVIIPSRK